MLSVAEAWTSRLVRGEMSFGFFRGFMWQKA